MTTYIYVVAHHQENDIRADEVYKPFYVGQAAQELDGREGVLTDRSGDNIAERNPHFCELTAIYWLMKNLGDSHPDNIGICHYRRYFNFDEPHRYGTKTVDPKKKRDFKYSNLNIDKLLEGKDIILNIPYPHSKSIYTDFATGSLCHKEDLDKMQKVIAEKTPEYLPCLNRVMEGNKFASCNMFVCRWDLFCDMWQWIFSVLFELEKRIDLTGRTPEQQRLWGYLSEVLVNVYVLRHDLRVRYLSHVFFNNKRKHGQLKFQFYRIKNNTLYQARKVLDMLSKKWKR